MSTGLCLCGCGRATTIRRGKPCRYITGHNDSGARSRPPSGRDIACTRCGKSSYAPASQVETRRFCSRLCRDSSRRERTGPAHPDYKRVEVACPCGVKVLVPPAKAAKSVYCSRACSSKGKGAKCKARHMKPGCESYGKARAMIRDSNACLICGFTDAVNVHHIRPKARGGDHSLDNLITLCPNHHALAHLGKLTEEELLDALSTVLRCVASRVALPLLQRPGVNVDSRGLLSLGHNRGGYLGAGRDTRARLLPDERLAGEGRHERPERLRVPAPRGHRLEVIPGEAPDAHERGG